MYAAHEHPALNVVTHLDERSAGFFALGVGRASGRPAAVITTSGTAVANLLPAVVEAAQSDTPLVVLSADRPPELRGTDANQTIDQVRIFGPYTRRFADLPLPESAPATLEVVRGLVRDSLDAATSAPPGPVHLNCPFAKPLEPDGAPWGAPQATVAVPDGGGTAPHAGDTGRLIDRLRAARRPLFVAGPLRDPVTAGPAIASLARTIRAPLLADPLSGARFAAGVAAVSVAHYDAFLREESVLEGLVPDLVVRFGATPTSAAVPDALRRWRVVPQIVIDDGWRLKDHTRTAAAYVRAAPAAMAAAAAGTEALDAGDPAWLAAWKRVDLRAGEVLTAGTTDDPFEATIVVAVVEALPAGANLVIGNSMPVRDLDRFAGSRDQPLHIWGNRGASGIDGMVGTALGVAAASGGPTVALLGDLSFYHDQNGLFATRSLPAVLFVVINNDGGGIFELLPVRAFEPAFTQRVAVPHGFDFSHVAALHRLRYARAKCGDDIVGTVRKLLDEGRPALFEISSDREHNRRRHEETLNDARRAVRTTMASGVQA